MCGLVRPSANIQSHLHSWLHTSFHHSSKTRLSIQIHAVAYPSHTHTLNNSSFSQWIIGFIYLCHRRLLQDMSLVCRLKPLFVESNAQSSRTVHCPQLFKDACILSWHRAVNIVNGYESLKVMTKQYAFITREHLLSLSVTDTGILAFCVFMENQTTILEGHYCELTLAYHRYLFLYCKHWWMLKKQMRYRWELVRVVRHVEN